MILYFGNILSGSGNVPSFIEVFIPKIKDVYPITSASTKSNKILRLMDMIFTLVRHARKTHVVLIDTYSYQDSIMHGYWVFCVMFYLFPISQLFMAVILLIVSNGHRD